MLTNSLRDLHSDALLFGRLDLIPAPAAIEQLRNEDVEIDGSRERRDERVLVDVHSRCRMEGDKMMPQEDQYAWRSARSVSPEPWQGPFPSYSRSEYADANHGTRFTSAELYSDAIDSATLETAEDQRTTHGHTFSNHNFNHNDHNSLPLIFIQMLLSTLFWLLLANHLFTPASPHSPSSPSASLPTVVSNTLQTLIHSWPGLAATLTLAFLTHRIANRYLMTLLPSSTTATTAKVSIKHTNRLWLANDLIKVAVCFVAISCALNIATSLGLVNNLASVEMARYISCGCSGSGSGNCRHASGVVEGSNWAVQAGFRRERFEALGRKIEEWRVREKFWRVMEWVEEGDVLVDWM